MSEYNPFAARLARYKQYLANVEAEQERHRQSDMPGTFVTGGSGVSAKRRAKVDAQLEATVRRSGKIQYWREKVTWMQAKHDAYKPIVHVSDEDHKETWHPGKFPPELIEEVKRQVAAHIASHVAYKDRPK